MKNTLFEILVKILETEILWYLSVPYVFLLKFKGLLDTWSFHWQHTFGFEKTQRSWYI